MNIFEKLIKIQNELKCPKDKKNNFGGYNFRSCEQILENLKPLLEKHKATVILKDGIINIEGRFYLKSTTEFIDIETGDKLEAYALAREDEQQKGMSSSQLTGATSSYARKYSLGAMFLIDDGVDHDQLNIHDKEAAKAKLSEAQIKRAYTLGNKAGFNNSNVDKQILSKFKKPIQDLTKEEYDKVCLGYEKMGR